MTDKLRALTVEEAEIFANRRESPVVVQHRCVSCSAWYENDKAPAAYLVAFRCDCGQDLAWTVPAFAGPRALTDAELLVLNDPAARLDTGMKAQEAVQRAAQWWEARGRKLMRQMKARQQLSVASSDKGNGGAFASPDPDSENFLPSSLMHARPWDDLTRREKAQIVKAWHHFFVRMPDQPETRLPGTTIQ